MRNEVLILFEGCELTQLFKNALSRKIHLWNGFRQLDIESNELLPEISSSHNQCSFY